MRRAEEDSPAKVLRTSRVGRPVQNTASDAGGVPGRKLWSGEGGIRTLGDVAATPVFETGPIGHSGTSPNRRCDLTFRGL